MAKIRETAIFAAPFPRGNNRKGAGVADRGSLENCCTINGTEGSNPSLSAKEVAETPDYQLDIRAFFIGASNKFQMGQEKVI